MLLSFHLLKSHLPFDTISKTISEMFRHNFLTIEFGSEISSRPDLIQRNIQSKTFKAGFYQSKGHDLGEGTISMKTLFVRPKHPFGISKKTWSKEWLQEILF